MAIGTSGVGLPYPQVPFPIQVGNPLYPQVLGSNTITMPPGGVAMVPAGWQSIDPGQYCFVQFKDPVTGVWRPMPTEGKRGHLTVNSDGFNYRVLNPTGCLLGILVTNGGDGYSSAAPPSVAISSGGATAVAVIGGAIGAINFSINSGTVTSGVGDNYTFAPIVSIAAPASGGVQATATAILNTATGSLTGFRLEQQGAGYQAAPAVYISRHPFDPTYGTIIDATAVATLTGSASVTAILVTNAGNGSLGGVPAITVAAPSAGTQATAQALPGLIVTGVGITTSGSNLFGQPVIAFSNPRNTATPAYANTFIQRDIYLTRDARVAGALASGNLSSATVLDGGLYQVVPTAGAVAAEVAGLVAIAPVVTVAMGSASDTIIIQSVGGGA